MHFSNLLNLLIQTLVQLTNVSIILLFVNIHFEFNAKTSEYVIVILI